MVGSPPAAATAGAVEAQPTYRMSPAAMADGDVTNPGTSSSLGLVAPRISGVVSEYQPPDATPRPLIARSAVAAPASAKATGEAVRSETSRGAACSGTRSCVDPEVRTSRPDTSDTYSRGMPAWTAADVGSS